MRTRKPADPNGVRIWIPDLDAASFRVEAHRQSLAVASSAAEREDQDFVDAISGGVSGED